MRRRSAGHFACILATVLCVTVLVNSACSGTIPQEEEQKDCISVCEGLDCGEQGGCQCGLCPEGYQCAEGKCVECDPPDDATEDPCEASCLSAECGSADGCDCGTCPDGQECTDGGVCEDVDTCPEICAGLE